MTGLIPGYTPPETVPDFNDLRGRAPVGIRDAGATRELWIANEAYNMGHYEHFRQHRELFRRPETPMPKPELKVGQVWRARNGQVVRIVSQADGVSYSLGGSNGLCYTSSGAYRKSSQQSEDDLIELISDAPVPPAEPALTPRLFAAPPVRTYSPNGAGMVVRLGGWLFRATQGLTAPRLTGHSSRPSHPPRTRHDRERTAAA